MWKKRRCARIPQQHDLNGAVALIHTQRAVKLGVDLLFDKLLAHSPIPTTACLKPKKIPKAQVKTIIIVAFSYPRTLLTERFCMDSLTIVSPFHSNGMLFNCTNRGKRRHPAGGGG